ncbi:MAG: SAM-dependent methyltransferase [Candidatus Dormiibacterota bacterium]
MAIGPSRTAVAAAVSRAIHLMDSAPQVFNDTLALDLAGEEGQARLAELRKLPEESLYPMAMLFAIRSRYVEDMVEAAVAEGVTQYVLLGAGLDSFAYRRGDLLEQRLRVFEVDAPGTQAYKRSRLEELGVATPEGLTFVPVDFEKDALVDSLVAAGLNPLAPVALSWIAVIPYLTRPAIDATLDAVSSLPPGSRIALSYTLPPEVMNERNRRGFHWTANRTAEVGEPFQTLFEPAQIERALRVLGFSRVDHFTSRDAKRRYLADRPDLDLADIERLLTATI